MGEGKQSSEYNKKNIFNKKFKTERKRKKLLRTVYFQEREHSTVNICCKKRHWEDPGLPVLTSKEGIL